MTSVQTTATQRERPLTRIKKRRAPARRSFTLATPQTRTTRAKKNRGEGQPPLQSQKKKRARQTPTPNSHTSDLFFFFLSTNPFAALLDKRGANGRLKHATTRWHSYAPRIGMLLLLRSASNLSRALSLCDPAPEALAISQITRLPPPFIEGGFVLGFRSRSGIPKVSSTSNPRRRSGRGSGQGGQVQPRQHRVNGHSNTTNTPAIASNTGKRVVSS